MKSGTAKITTKTLQGRTAWIVCYANIGSELRCEPQAFWTEQEARAFCRSRLLTII